MEIPITKQDLLLIRDIISEINKDASLTELFDNTIGVYGRFNQCSLHSILINVENILNKKRLGNREQYIVL